MLVVAKGGLVQVFANVLAIVVQVWADKLAGGGWGVCVFLGADIRSGFDEESEEPYRVLMAQL